MSIEVTTWTVTISPKEQKRLRRRIAENVAYDYVGQKTMGDYCIGGTRTKEEARRQDKRAKQLFRLKMKEQGF